MMHGVTDNAAVVYGDKYRSGQDDAASAASAGQIQPAEHQKVGH